MKCHKYLRVASKYSMKKKKTIISHHIVYIALYSLNKLHWCSMQNSVMMNASYALTKTALLHIQ